VISLTDRGVGLWHHPMRMRGSFPLFLGTLTLVLWAGASDPASAQSRRVAGASAGSAMASVGAMREREAEVPKKGAATHAGPPLLFDTQETESENFEPFAKWTGAVDKMKKEAADQAKFKTNFAKWLTVLDGLKGKDVETQLGEVNKLMNQATYVTDPDNWGVSDYWASPGEFLAKFGDCEDYAIAKYMALKYVGFPADNMRIVAVKDQNLKVGHAILAVYHDDRIDLLDNQIKIVVDARKVHHYEPVYSINEKHWWRHRAPGSSPSG
jgi:predicted transglutaminase-like cysteine proteinase